VLSRVRTSIDAGIRESRDKAQDSKSRPPQATLNYFIDLMCATNGSRAILVSCCQSDSLVFPRLLHPGAAP
jgi:hypothetical protein